MEASNWDHLVRSSKAGSESAFNELYLLTRDAAFFVAVSITKNQEDALDILQEAYLKAWKNLAALRDPAQFKPWFNQITANAAKSYIKKRNPTLFGDVAALNSVDCPDLQADKDTAYIPDASLDVAETRQLIMEIIEGLPEDQRLCVMLYYYEDMPITDIAAALELPPGTVMSRLRLARDKIGRGVNDLEKRKGIKLYSVAPIPLAIYLLRQLPAHESAALPPFILGNATTTASAGAGIAAKIAGLGLPKLAAICTTAAVLVGAGAAIAVLANRDAKQSLPRAMPAEKAVIAETFTQPLISLPALEALVPFQGETAKRAADALFLPATPTQRQGIATERGIINMRDTTDAAADAAMATEKKSNPADTAGPATTIRPTIAARRTATAKPTTNITATTSANITATTSAVPTTSKPTTTPVFTTTSKPITTPAPTTTSKPITTPAPTTTSKPTTTPAPTTTSKPITTPAPTTTAKPTTTPAPTTTATTTTTAVPTTVSPDGRFLLREYGVGWEIAEYLSSSANVWIPPVIDGKTVLRVGAGAFQGKGLADVVVNDPLTAIGDYAFADNPGLIIELPGTVASIAGDVFSGCVGLVVLCPAGSYAESYANGMGFTVVNV
ncbi:MAG: sigma-70 family RNA polymerase sigma factor [Clostridia bacterium]|nr:sigma-70 family RNA polymerase sigma factor [Clostridia bacterium]